MKLFRRESSVPPVGGNPSHESDVSVGDEDIIGMVREREYQATQYAREGMRIEAKLARTHQELERRIRDFDAGK